MINNIKKTLEYIKVWVIRCTNKATELPDILPRETKAHSFLPSTKSCCKIWKKKEPDQPSPVMKMMVVSASEWDVNSLSAASSASSSSPSWGGTQHDVVTRSPACKPVVRYTSVWLKDTYRRLYLILLNKHLFFIVFLLVDCSVCVLGNVLSRVGVCGDVACVGQKTRRFTWVMVK